MTQARVVVVEDNAANMRLVRDVLTFDGYTVIEATTAEEGIALAQEHIPQVILLDIQLPGGMDGLDAVKRLKHDEKTMAIPVVAVTAFAMVNDKQRGLEAGFDGYLEKPFNIDDLRDMVRRLVDRRSDDGE